MSIKYYHLAKDETPPEEFCAIRDVDGEPSEYMFYVSEAENSKLREALCAAWKCVHAGINCSDCRLIAGGCTLQTAMQELGIEIPE